MSLTPEQVVKIAGNIKVLQAQRDEIDEAIENQKQTLADNLPTERQQFGDFDINIYTGARFDEAYGKKANPELWEKHAVEKKVLTSAVAKASMSEDEYALFQKPNTKTTVVVEMLDD